MLFPGRFSRSPEYELSPLVLLYDHRAATISIQSEDGVCIMRSDIAKAKANAIQQAWVPEH